MDFVEFCLGSSAFEVYVGYSIGTDIFLEIEPRLIYHICISSFVKLFSSDFW